MSEEENKEIKIAPPSSEEENSAEVSRNQESRAPTFRKRFIFKKRECYFTKNKIAQIDCKDVELLKKFIGKNGRILPRRFTGTSSLFQRKLARAIKQARAIALLPYTGEIDFRPKFNNRKVDIPSSDKKEEIRDVKQESAKHDVKQEPAKHNVKQEPAKHNVKQEPAKHDVKQEPAKHDVKQEPAKHDVKQEPAKHNENKNQQNMM